MCTFSNEFAIVVLGKNMTIIENRNKVGEKLAGLLPRYVDIYKDKPHVSNEGDAVHVYIMYGRYANSVVREALVSEMSEGLVTVSVSAKDAHEQIEKMFPEYEFLNQSKVMESFMERTDGGY